MVAGLAGLAVFAAALAWRAQAAGAPAFQPLLLGLAHTAVLGWLLPTALGALHRMAPLLLGATIPSERASWVAFGLYGIGALGLTGHLWTFSLGWGLPFSAVTLAAAILLYVGNLSVALVRGRARSGPSGAFVGAALAWLSVTALLGAALAWNLWSPFLRSDHTQWLKAHAHAGGLGFFGLLVMGAAMRLLEMFLVSSGAPLGASRAAWAATNAALASLVLGFTGAGPAGLVPLGAVLASAGVACFLAQARSIHARRLSRRADHALKHTAASLGWLAAAAGVGVALALDLPPLDRRPGLEVAYGTLALVGFLGGIVTGQLYKILPSVVGEPAPPPLLKLRVLAPGAPAPGVPDAPVPLRAQWLLAQGAVAALVLGMALDAPPLRATGGALFAAGALLFLVDVVKFARVRAPRSAA